MPRSCDACGQTIEISEPPPETCPVCGQALGEYNAAFAFEDLNSPFSKSRLPSVYEAYVERTARQRRLLKQGLFAVGLEVLGVMLAASTVASLGQPLAVFGSAAKYSLLTMLVGGGALVVLAALASTGVFRQGGLVGVVRVAIPADPPRGEPVIVPIALAASGIGVYLFGCLGAAVGATGGGGPEPALPLVFLASLVGLAPALIWWFAIRQSR